MFEIRVSDIPPYAVIVFADVIDSSKFSSVLGYKKYAERLIIYQQLFKSLGERYFPQPTDKSIGYCKVDARGDEGIIFCVEHRRKERAALVFKAIDFLYHIKSLLYFDIEKAEEEETSAPIKMGIGAGIHVGKVAVATKIVAGKKEIVQIDGFSINKAKRIESASRIGKYSRIMISKEAASLLEGEPILLAPITTSMKGIEDNAELFEVKSGLFNKIQIELIDNKIDEKLVTKVLELADKPHEIEEPWLKAFIISILDILIEKNINSDKKILYRDMQLKLSWRSSIEEDPILLYLRAREYHKKEKYTQQIRYLHQILKNHPDFVFAKKSLAKACWQLTKKAQDQSEKVFARDIAEEFLNKFSKYLTPDDVKEFANIVKASLK